VLHTVTITNDCHVGVLHTVTTTNLLSNNILQIYLGILYSLQFSLIGSKFQMLGYCGRQQVKELGKSWKYKTI
jgi:hypothetical protein